MVNKSLVSIVIPSYNSESFIIECLTSLISQKADIEFEIIVVGISKNNTHKNVLKSVLQYHLHKIGIIKYKKFE